MDLVFQRKPQKSGVGAESYWRPATPTSKASIGVSNHHATRHGHLEADFHLESYHSKLNVLEECSLDDPNTEIRLLKFAPQAHFEHQDELWLELSAWTVPEWAKDNTYVAGVQEDIHITPSPRKPPVPSYVAVSYTWGRNDTAYRIYVNNRHFAIRSNCHYALKQVWAHYPDQYIWLDSICINQDDADEKSIQVQRMGPIFAQADHVLICIGPHSNGSESLLDYGHELREFHRSTTQEHGQQDPGEVPESYFDALRFLRNRVHVTECLEAIRAFADRPYWSRLWIVQEIACAQSKQILCGDLVLDFEYTKYFQVILGPEGYDYFRTVTSKASPGSLSLHEAVMRFQTFHCSDVRDRLFGILGLINWGFEGPAITIANYSRTPFEVLLSVVNYSKFIESRVIDALNMFGQISTTREMRQLIAHARRDTVDIRTSETEVEDPYDVRKLHISPSSLCQLVEDQRGRLVGNFVRKPLQANPDHLKSKFLLQSRNQETSTLIYSAGMGCVAALACAQAKKGDLLVSGSSHREENMIVLRENATQDYDIIGQALGVDGFCIASDEHLREKRAVLKLTAPEAVLLFGQDYLGMDERGRAVIDPQAQSERVRTAVVLSTSPSTGAFLRESALQRQEHFE